MNARRSVWLCLLPVLGGCGTLSWNEPETIGSLKGRQVPVAEEPVRGDTREQAMSNYRDFLGTSEDEKLRPEAMRRLADLQLEQEELRQAAVSEQGEPLPAVDLEATVGMYQTLLRDYPNYPHQDKALYQLARAYEDAGKTELVLATLSELVSKHPNTPLRAEAEFRRGEILFVQRQYREAEAAYQAVLTRGDDSDFYERALYKMGWARFKQGFYEEALDAFVELLDRRLAGDAGARASMSRAERELLDDSLRVVSLSFSYQEGPASVGAYFERRGERAYEDLIYANLGELYLGKERYSDAADVFHAFVERHPLHRQAPAFQVRVIEAYKAGQFPTLVLAAKKDFVERYALTAPFWSVHDQASAADVVIALKANLQDLARHYHALAQQSKDAQDYAEAARWYQAFLVSFPRAEEAPRMNFLLAEVHFESKSYDRAAEAYEKTAYDYPPHPQAAEAGYAALLAFDRHAAALSGAQLANWKRRAISSALRFADAFPAHPQANTVLTKAAEDLFKLGEYAMAAKAGQQVVDSAASTPELRRTAWTVVAHSSFDLGDYPRAEGAYQKTLALVPGNDPGRQDLVERLAASIYRQGEQARRDGDLRAAAGHFGRVARNAPGASIVATADYDAATALLELKDWSQSIPQLEAFRRNHPEHELQSEVTRNLAIAYLEGGRPQQAAAEFERIAQESADPAVQREALWQAAELYEQAQQRPQAIRAWKGFAERFPAPLEAAIEARQHVADLQGAMGASNERLATLNSLVQAESAAGAAGRTDRTRYLASKAALELAEPARLAYQHVQLKAPLKKNLELKKQRLETAVERYTKVAEYGVAEVMTEATYQIADIYRQFGRALMESERPAGLSAEELEQYELLLEEQAYPFEEKAIEVHEANVARIPGGIYDGWVRKSLHELSRLLPARYAKQERGEALVADMQ